MIRADLHIHTYYSDGLVTPGEVVAEAKRNGVRLIAVTDHDTMLATEEVKAFAKREGVEAISGIEVSAYEGDVKLHTLGYNVDENCPQYKAFAAELYEGSLPRAKDVLMKLNANGVSITLNDVLSERKYRNSPVHGMYIARAACKKGYAKAPFVFYAQYLSAGKCAFSAVGRPTPERAVQVITSCGGFASLAHPARVEMEKEELFSLLKRLKACGLGGIEAVYSAHTAFDTAYYKETAGALSLEVTGGSDTHYFGGRRKIGSPEFYIGKALADKLSL